MLIGIGILGFPYALRCTGWSGLGLLAFVMLSTCHTARILGKCLSMYPQLQSFSDIGREAFGFPMEIFIGIVFFIELFLACSAYLIIAGDNLAKLFPSVLSQSKWMIVVALIILPSTWLSNLVLLSYLSIFGIIATLFLLVVVVFIGLSHFEAPGSLWDPSETQLINWDLFPLAIGLMMSGFAGHAVLPNIYHSMDNKRQFNSMIHSTFVIASIIYITMSVCGYIMFGNDIQEEITLNMDPNNILVQFSTWMTILNPMTKFALTLNPSKNVQFLQC